MARTIMVISAALALGGWAQAGERVDNFVLLDQHGQSHELYYLSDARAVVLMVQGNGCTIVRNALPTLQEIRSDYAAQRVEFLLINSNLQDDRATILAESQTFGIEFPILVDEAQLIGESLGFVRTAEVIVIDPDDWTIAYRGPIDDRLGYETQKPKAKEHYLRDALDAVLDGEQVAPAKRDTVGCLINFPERGPREHASISYAETIAPLLVENCVPCHREGGIGPWAMTSYAMVHGFAPMIREVIRTQRMPPWHADPHIGDFKDDRGLSVAQMQTLVHWIEAGAPRGDGRDPLEDAAKRKWIDWPLGQPDLIVEIPVFDVPATGVIDYQYPVVASGLKEGVWVQATQVLPGDRSVVHHVIAGFDTGDRIRGSAVFRNHLATYAPGVEPHRYPEDSGIYVPAGAHFVFQMHYTPSGKATTDASRVGLYFVHEPPTHFLRHRAMIDPTIRIPAHAKAHTDSVYYLFQRDVVLYGLFPHAHYRGRASSFTAIYPDGREERLLSVPRYDFNWQRFYDFTEPKALPAGTRLVHTTTWDNSAQNPANPDPAREVTWGLQSFDEMLYGAFTFRYVGEDPSAPIDDRRIAVVAQMMGYLDTDQDGKLVFTELGPRLRRMLAGRFDEFDLNGDGALDGMEVLGMRRTLMRFGGPEFGGL